MQENTLSNNLQIARFFVKIVQFPKENYASTTQTHTLLHTLTDYEPHTHCTGFKFSKKHAMLKSKRVGPNNLAYLAKYPQSLNFETVQRLQTEA